MTNLDGKTTVVLFYVDKDIDDILRICKRSQHLIYTQYYDLLNYIFEEGDIVTGAAAAASMDPQLLAPRLSVAHRWCQEAAEKWKEWVKLCIFVNKHSVHCESNYRVNSKVNKPPNDPVDTALYAAKLQQLERASRLTGQAFLDKYEPVSRRVDKYYALGQHHRIFKGKWYAVLLVEDIKAIAGPKGYASKGLRSKVPSTIMATLDFDQPWANHLRAPLESLVSHL